MDRVALSCWPGKEAALAPAETEIERKMQQAEEDLVAMLNRTHEMIQTNNRILSWYSEPSNNELFRHRLIAVNKEESEFPVVELIRLTQRDNER